jgi:hypothetical protein
LDATLNAGFATKFPLYLAATHLSNIDGLTALVAVEYCRNDNMSCNVDIALFLCANSGVLRTTDGEESKHEL